MTIVGLSYAKFKVTIFLYFLERFPKNMDAANKNIKINHILSHPHPVLMDFRQTMTYLLHGFMLGYRVEHSVLVWIWLNIVGWLYLLASLNFPDILVTSYFSSLHPTAPAIPPSPYLLIVAIGYLVWGWLGGALYRSIAVQFVESKKISLLQKLQFGWRHYVHFFSGTILLWMDTGIIISLVYSLIIIAKAVLTWPILGIIVCILAGLIVAILGVIAGWMILNCLWTPGMIYASIAMESNDHYDATSRAITYLWSQIGYFLFYHIFLFILVMGSGTVLATIWYCIFVLCHFIPHPAIASFILAEITIIFLSVMISCYVGGKIAIYNVLRQQHEKLPLGHCVPTK